MFYRLYRGVPKYIVYGNTFSSFEWLRSLHTAHHGAVNERQKQVENEQLVPKWRTTSVAWSRIFKHCSFKTTDFEAVENQTTELYACAISFCVRGVRLFFLPTFERLHELKYMHQNPRLCKYPYKQSDLGLKSE